MSLVHAYTLLYYSHFAIHVNQIMNNVQHGFRQCRSCMSAFPEVNSDIGT